MIIRASAVVAVVCAASATSHAAVIGGVNLGNLTNNLFVFTDGSQDANWQSSSKGYVGSVAVNGGAAFRTSGSFAYSGTISSGGGSLGAWQGIVNNNSGQASSSLNQSSRLTGLTADLSSAFAQINALTASTGYTSRSATSLDGLNTQNGIAETFVINVTSGLQVSSQISIRGDASDVFILRWDTDANAANGYNGQVKFQSGGGIVPQGGLTAGNFIHVAGDINASGGGSNPPAPFPQGPRLNNGLGALITNASDFSGGGFFTGYWLTTGDPTNGDTSSLSNGIFVGGWYTSSDKFSLTSGTSGVYVPPVPAPSGLAALALGIFVAARRRR
ncbi:MAG: PEP-CTERM sorting domain-containing protein [Phycisphaerales bacterium]|nr:PEP-CTERM sorting domain-containing protein [Phycisphaerales bacterium]